MNVPPATPDPSPLLPFHDVGLFTEIPVDAKDRLRAAVTEVVLTRGEVLLRQGDPSEALYVILQGRMDVFADRPGVGRVAMGELAAGDPVGELQILTGGSHTATVTAAADCRLARLPRTAIETAARDAPAVMSRMADLIRRRLQHYRLQTVLPRLFGPMDGELFRAIEGMVRWTHLRRGEKLLRQGESDDTLYVLVSGRLTATVERDGAVRVAGEVHPGETVGEMALFTGERRSATVTAARDAELIGLTKRSCEDIVSRTPRVVMEIARIVIERLQRHLDGNRPACGLANVAVLPAHGGVPLGEFSDLLASALSGHGSVLPIGSAAIDALLGTPGISQAAEEDPNNIRLEAWLDEQEARHDVVLYVADPGDTEWSRRCARQADKLLLLAEAARAPEEARPPAGAGRGARPDLERFLVLLSGAAFPAGGARFSGTERWLAATEADRCFHVELRGEGDVPRLARFLTGRAVGLVLSGGGAKGYAHIGVIRALEEAGIPIDMIAGTSMGSVVSAAYAMGLGPSELVRRNKELFRRYRPFREYTIPFLSLVKGRRLDAVIRAFFGDARIEDLRLPFFCVSTNLTAAEPFLHARGPLGKAVRASVSIPGVLPPVVEGGTLLVDGGVVNNLPGDLMREFCRGTVITVDTTPKREVEIGEGYARYPGAWTVLWSRINPFDRKHRLPGIVQIMGRTTMLNSIYHVRKAGEGSDFHLNPPVQGFGMLEFDAIDAIVEAGYRYARERIEEWKGIARRPDRRMPAREAGSPAHQDPIASARPPAL